MYAAQCGALFNMKALTPRVMSVAAQVLLNARGVGEHVNSMPFFVDVGDVNSVEWYATAALCHLTKDEEGRQPLGAMDCDQLR